MTCGRESKIVNHKSRINSSPTSIHRGNNIQFKTMKNILLIILLISNYSISVAQDVDLTSVDEFFKVTSTLKAGKEISQKQWEQFDSSSAYAIFTQNKNKKIIHVIKSSIQKVFGNKVTNEEIPNDKTSLLEKLVLTNYQDINNNYLSIKSFRDNYDFNTLLMKAKQRLNSFLCCDTLDSSIKWKPVYFFFLSADGKDMDNALFIDFNLIYKLTEQQRIDFLAHEFFHNYRTHFENHEFNYANDINFMLDMIQNEGIADQIDKYMGYKKYFSDVLTSPEETEIFTTLYNNAENDIKQLQTIIVQYSKKRIDKKLCIDKLLEIYKYNGHAIGFYMSNQIIKAGYKKEMVKSFYNPYKFYQLYNLAACKNKTVMLNDDFMIFLKNITQGYYPQ